MEGLTKRIGDKTILENVNLRLDRGKCLAIFGPNGAGKTTFLKILSSLVKPTSGNVEIDGIRIGDDAGRICRKLGVIFHQPFLYENLTPYENLSFYGRMYGVPRLKRRVEEVLEEVGLSLFMNDPVRTFSRGMVQRLSIARAILHDPPLLLLDEPYTGLDQQATGLLGSLLGRFRAEGRTMVMITHRFEEGLAISDQMMILSKGRVVYAGDTGSMDLDGLKRTYLKYAEEGSGCPS